MKFMMEEFWNDNLTEGIITDVMNGQYPNNVIITPRCRQINIKITDNWIKFCPECNKLWEKQIQAPGYIYHSIRHIPKYGKKEEVCPNCEKLCDSCGEKNGEYELDKEVCDERKDATKEDGIWVCKECKKKYPKE